jgi:hypothetical protein
MSRKDRLQAKADRHLARMECAGNQPHALFIVEGTGGAGQDPETGLPVFDDPVPSLVTPAPWVKLGAKLIESPGGGLVRLGDAEVKGLSRTDWSMERLLSAHGFRLDSPSGELYRIVHGTLKESGAATWKFLLERASQPRS